MKKTILSILFVLFSLFSFSQKTINGSYVIKENTSGYSNVFISSSIEKSDLEAYRLKEKNSIIKFKNGFTIELLSAKELYIKGLISNVDQYKESFSENIDKMDFNMLSSGNITIGIHENIHPKSIKK